MAKSENIKIGDRIRIIHLEGEDDRYDGREGVVEMIPSDNCTGHGAGWLSFPKQTPGYG